MAFAGVWQVWHRGDAPLTTCAIVTAAAAPGIARIHHRMPVAVAPEDWPLWLGEAGHGAARSLRADVAARAAADWRAWRVDRAVNSNRARGANLIAPVDGRPSG